MESITFRKISIYSILSTVLLFVSVSSSGQKITSFSENTKEFLVDLDKYLNRTQNDELRKLSKEISKKFNKLEISLDNQRSIRNVCDLMLKSKMKPSPYFKSFLNSVVYINDDIRNKSKLSSWLVVCENIVLNNSSKGLLKYCEFTQSFLKTTNLRDSKSVNWSVDYSDFRFQDKQGVPYIHFSDPVTLGCSNRNGSFFIFETKGDYWIFNNNWNGNNGIINWEDRGFSSDSVYAELSYYNIDIRDLEFKADSVTFHNKHVFDSPIIGQVINKLVAKSNAHNYPIFKSYNKDIVIPNLLPDVDYQGGYTLMGNDFVADGRRNASAKMIVKKEGKKILVANALRFSIKKNIIYSATSSVKIYFDEDSIYHPSLQFTYDQSERKLILYRDKKGVSGSPIYNSYHQITIDAELLEWQIDEDEIYLGSLPVSAVSEVNFESIANYNDHLYYSLRGIDKENPLTLINRFMNISGKTKFTAAEFALFAGYPETQIQHFLMNLSNKGFLFYNLSQNKVSVQQKFYNYINARSQSGDYDVIRFHSKISNSNGDNMIINSSLNLSTKDLEIEGVGIVSLSDSQKVYVQPYGSVMVKKNRDFSFSGKVSVGKGRLVLHGKDFQFNYDKFKIDLTQIDSVQLAVPIIPIERDKYGNHKLVQIRTVIQAGTGDLKIDDPANKSGIRKNLFPQYPIFKSFDDSYVYYDKPSTFKGVYNREDFYFHLDTFEIDSLERFNGKGLRFPGTFESAGIFPTLNDTLTMMDDYSLGFKRKAPEEGFQIYGGKATYSHNIYLSNTGLTGSGKLEYLTSITNSDEIYFFPDSTALFSQDFTLSKVEEGIEFPDVKNGKTFALFDPYHDTYKIYKLKKGFNFYNEQATFNGDIILRPTGLIGQGIMNLENIETSSDLFTYNANWFAADTASLTVFTDSKAISFRSNNLKTNIDLEDRTGDFFSNGEGSYVEFPANQYICYIDKVHWLMDEGILNLGDQDQSSLGSQFVSIHPEQDSLSFVAKTSSYNLKYNIINVFGVQEILVADAVIYPSKDGFSIKKNGFIPTIRNANILTNTMTKYHQFSNASININGSKTYTAEGDYTYQDKLGEDYHIFFEKIFVENGQTVAVGQVNHDALFRIGPKFNFKGSVNLFASSKYLRFNGYFKMNNKCNLINDEWVAFESEINPESIRFSLDTVLKNEEQDKLSTGILMNLDPAHMYTAFLSRKERAIDVAIITANTYLTYDELGSSFVMQGQDSMSNIFMLNENTCASQSEGEIDLNMDFGQIKLKTIGSVDRDEANNKTEFRIFLLLDFMFSESALSVMSEDIYEAYGDIKFRYGDFYKKTLSRLVGKDRSEELIIDVEALDEFNNLPKELNNTMSFTDLTLVWSDDHQAYINKGKIGIGNVYDRQLNSLMDGHIRLSKKNGEDILDILLKTEYGDIYFFEYKNNVMHSYSTNEKYNNILIETKAKKRRSDERKGRSPYRYVYCSEEKMERFEKEMRQID